MRAAVLVPWAIPTVVSALLWRFMFEGQTGIVNSAAGQHRRCCKSRRCGSSTAAAWVPVILADVWKTTPFVALLLLAGLQNIDASLYEAAAHRRRLGLAAVPPRDAAAAQAGDSGGARSSARWMPSGCST